MTLTDQTHALTIGEREELRRLLVAERSAHDLVDERVREGDIVAPPFKAEAATKWRAAIIAYDQAVFDTNRAIRDHLPALLASSDREHATADRLAAVEAERDEERSRNIELNSKANQITLYQERNNILREERNALEAERDRLREALKPLAAAATSFIEAYPEIKDTTLVSVPMVSLRRARAALSPSPTTPALKGE